MIERLSVSPTLSHTVFFIFALASILFLKDSRLISVSRVCVLAPLPGALLSQGMAVSVSSLKAPNACFSERSFLLKEAILYHTSSLFSSCHL